jgi:hypothetical protein
MTTVAACLRTAKRLGSFGLYAVNRQDAEVDNTTQLRKCLATKNVASGKATGHYDGTLLGEKVQKRTYVDISARDFV